MADPSRNFSVFHAMVLVAATAAGLGLIRSLSRVDTIAFNINISVIDNAGEGRTRAPTPPRYRDRKYLEFWPKTPIKMTWWRQSLLIWSQNLSFWPAPMLAIWTLATAGLGYRKGRRIVRRPGAVAGLAVLLAALATLTFCPQLLKPWKGTLMDNGWPFWWPAYWSVFPRIAGFAVVVAWVVLVAGRRWAPEPTWHDRLGRGLGACWIALAVSSTAAEWLLVFFT